MGVFNKVLPIMILIINIGMAGLIYSSFTYANNMLTNSYGNQFTPIMYVSLIFFTLFFYIGIPLLIFYSEEDALSSTYKVLDDVVVGLSFIFLIRLSPLVSKILLNVLELVFKVGPVSAGSVVLMWFLLLVMLVALPIFVYFASPTVRLKNRVTTGEFSNEL